jgi:6-pyruvoyltetrahydropterin/6-carboxytetrahydropterin synthase
MTDSKLRATRYHDICAGHRVYGHESKCANLHGHNYRFHFSIVAKNGLDHLGRVLDFEIIKNKLCEWLEKNWDHKFLIWEKDPLSLVTVVSGFHDDSTQWTEDLRKSFVVVRFNPTAENMALYIMNELAPSLLNDTGCYLETLTIEETRKCSVTIQC